MLDKLKKHNGFTMVEILIGIVIGAIVMGAIYSTYIIQSKSAVVDEQVAEMQQNLRAALYMIAREIRMAGHDPEVAGGFGISTAANNSISHTCAADFDDDGVFTDTKNITYSIPGGTTDLCRNDGGGNIVLSENIEALGFAYAFDQDGNGLVDTAGGNTIWAIDTNGDNQLDVNLDTDNDGDIDVNDNPAGVGLGGFSVAVGQIRAVKIWVLARAGRQDSNFLDRKTHVVANQRITPNDSLRRRLLTTTVTCRNMGL